jgi:hypothetical protein
MNVPREDMSNSGSDIQRIPSESGRWEDNLRPYRVALGLVFLGLGGMLLAMAMIRTAIEAFRPPL